MINKLLVFLRIVKKEELLVLTKITAGFQKVKDDLKALQAQNKAAIEAHNKQIADLAAKALAAQTEHDQAVAIHDNIAKLLQTN